MASPSKNGFDSFSSSDKGVISSMCSSGVLQGKLGKVDEEKMVLASNWKVEFMGVADGE